MGTISKLQVAQEVSTCWVRVTERDHRGFVEFQFSLGDPGLYLEMTLPPAAFSEFCRTHRVRVLSPGEAAVVDATLQRWRYGDEAEDCGTSE
jgi:phenol hydroxylase P0 protein